MLPLGPDEFLMSDEGGTATIDGVKIALGGDGTQELPIGSRQVTNGQLSDFRALAAGVAESH